MHLDTKDTFLIHLNIKYKLHLKHFNTSVNTLVNTSFFIICTYTKLKNVSRLSIYLCILTLQPVYVVQCVELYPCNLTTQH